MRSREKGLKKLLARTALSVSLRSLHNNGALPSQPLELRGSYRDHGESVTLACFYVCSLRRSNSLLIPLLLLPRDLVDDVVEEHLPRVLRLVAALHVDKVGPELRLYWAWKHIQRTTPKKAQREVYWMPSLPKGFGSHCSRTPTNLPGSYIIRCQTTPTPRINVTAGPVQRTRGARNLLMRVLCFDVCRGFLSQGRIRSHSCRVVDGGKIGQPFRRQDKNAATSTINAIATNKYNHETQIFDDPQRKRKQEDSPWTTPRSPLNAMSSNSGTVSPRASSFSLPPLGCTHQKSQNIASRRTHM